MILEFPSTMKETLSEYVRRVRREKNLSTSDVEKASKGRISDAYVSQIENGYVKGVSMEKLAALADGLGEDARDLFRVANGEDVKRPLRFEIYAKHFKAEELEDSEWQYLELFFLDAIERLRAYKRGIEALHVPLTTGQPPNKIAARIEPGDEARLKREIHKSLDLDAEMPPVRKRKAG